MINDLREVRSGDDILADDWNALVRWIKRNQIELGTNSGLEGGAGVSGTAIRVQRPRVATVALTTTTVTAGSSSAPGSGTATIKLFNGTAYVTLSLSETVFNTTEKIIASGAVLQCKKIDGYWFVDVPDKCSNLS